MILSDSYSVNMPITAAILSTGAAMEGENAGVRQKELRTQGGYPICNSILFCSSMLYHILAIRSKVHVAPTGVNRRR